MPTEQIMTAIKIANSYNCDLLFYALITDICVSPPKTKLMHLPLQHISLFSRFVFRWPRQQSFFTQHPPDSPPLHLFYFHPVRP